MRSLYIASTEGGGGKTTIAVGLCLALRVRGIGTGYFKPVGVAKNGDRDADVAFAAEVLGLTEPLEDLCPVTLNEQALRAMGDVQADAMARIEESYGNVAMAHELVVCDGLGEIWQGRFLRLSGADIVTRLGLETLLVSKFTGTRQLDDVCYTHDVLRKRLLGVVFTMIPETRLEVVEHHYVPFLEENGIRTFGCIPSDACLSAVPVSDIASALRGRFLSGEEWASASAETYLIGAMSADHALRYFERVPKKVVVVGGDREDLIRAALQTPTTALILTGSYVPSDAVLAQARAAKVSVVSVAGDTVAAAEGLRRLFGRLRVHERSKIDRVLQLIEERIDLERLLTALR